MIPQGPAVSRLSVNYTETVVLLPAGFGNTDEWERCGLEQMKRTRNELYCDFIDTSIRNAPDTA